MRSRRPAVVLLRAVMAVVFAFMSLGHGPVMTFAHARAMPAQHELAVDAPAHSHSHAVHHQANGPEDDAEPTRHVSHWQKLLPGAGAACFAIGCFVSLASFGIDAPFANGVPIAKLTPGPARLLVPPASEPADPPPRLQV